MNNNKKMDRQNAEYHIKSQATMLKNTELARKEYTCIFHFVRIVREAEELTASAKLLYLGGKF